MRIGEDHREHTSVVCSKLHLARTMVFNRTDYLKLDAGYGFAGVLDMAMSRAYFDSGDADTTWYLQILFYI